MSQNRPAKLARTALPERDPYRVMWQSAVLRNGFLARLGQMRPGYNLSLSHMNTERQREIRGKRKEKDKKRETHRYLGGK